MSSSTSSSALYNFKLLSALRSDDPSQVQPFLDEVKGDQTRAGNLLGMAVKIGTIPIIQTILSLPNLDINSPVKSGSKITALHVAAESGRADIVRLLLSNPAINDTIRDEQGKTPLESASSSDIARIIEDSRMNLQSNYNDLSSAYIASPISSTKESAALIKILESPRAEILNLNVLDSASGTSVLHEAARRRDARLVEMVVRKGADVFLRDKRGKRVLEGEKAPDEKIKAFLRQFNNQEMTVQPKSDGRPPDLKGFLSKWTNYKSGWRTRWFVLENGVLSYYRQREDEPVACRGSISLSVAAISASSDNSRFEVHSKASSSVPKIIAKSAHRGEIARWVQAIKLNIEYHSSASKGSPSGSITASASKSTLPSRQSTLDPSVAGALNAMPPTDSFLSSKLARTATGLSGSSIAGMKEPTLGNPSDDDENMSMLDMADDRSVAEGEAGVPHEGVFDLSIIAIKTQLELTEQLVDSISFGSPTTSPSSTAERAVDMLRTPSKQQAIKDAVKSSLSTLATQISQHKIMQQDRERYLLGRIDREIAARQLWEENMLTVAKQQEETDKQLTEAARVNAKKSKALKAAREVLSGIKDAGSLPTSPMGEEPPSAFNNAASNVPTISFIAPPATAVSHITDTSFKTARTHRQSISISDVNEVHKQLEQVDSEDSEDEEFFDAVDTGNIPNLKQYESIANPDNQRPGSPTGVVAPIENKMEKVSISKDKSEAGVKAYLARKSLEPYKNVRGKLPIDDDKRPSTSLWSILKSSVGKDLTKISFPVSFNECTSMLQRMAEDMEYDACLTVASQEEDSLKRIAFVGAFAMSNYSSTIGRIAKPFNPLLSQTYEYAIPNRYRYISEQVSHHPPISACYSEAPTWRYYGEVDAQNKFQGRSFEIRPTGVAHADLIIPKSWVKKGLDYPDAGPEYPDGYVVEHYSWKKVITNISNFIMGNPIIDHYGDLVVTNHRTNETCTLTFKPRTWRGKDAFEIKGQVVDASENLAWNIAGRWDTQLIARAASAGSGPLDVDAKISQDKEHLLLWRNSEKPVAPFNLTPFAITLNDIPTGLRPYLCPTDCRLRTDQRAFENADYDKAQELKTANEEAQRATRKARAEGKLPPHEARWFNSITDPDSGERLWKPKRAEDGEVLFWHEREEAPKAWEAVDHIFVEG